MPVFGGEVVLGGIGAGFGGELVLGGMEVLWGRGSGREG